MTPLLPRKAAVPVGCYPFTYRIVFRAWCLYIAGLCCLEPTSCDCPSVVRQGIELDAASKAHLAPLVFQGKLLEFNSQWPVLKATFRIQKIYKLIDKMAGLSEKTDVIVEFSTGRLRTKRGQACPPAKIDPKELRTDKRYLVFAAVRRPNDFVAVARPEPHSKRKVLAKTLCINCAQAPMVKHLDDVRVELRNRLKLRCEFQGNPRPRISWFKNGIRIRQNERERIRVRSKKRHSRLVVRKVTRLDGGQYECKATSILGSASSFAKVIVISSEGRHQNGQAATNDSTLWPLQGLPCPMTSYCLNGGTCSLYETVGEYVCECAEGYRGRRCESKAISTLSSPAPLDAPHSPHDLDATTRMLQHYWGK